MKRSYSTFSDKEVVPTKTVGGTEIMELFHGPTYAFKDVALQVHPIHKTQMAASLHASLVWVLSGALVVV